MSVTEILHTIDVEASEGVEERAGVLAALCRDAREFFREELGVVAEPRLLVLAERDWSRRTAVPFYGMPHCIDSRTIVVAGEDAPFWRRMAPPGLDTETVNGFFELLVVHELAHVVLSRAGRDFPRRWLTELFCNVSLDAFVGKRLPERRATLEALPRGVVASTDLKRLDHVTLRDFEAIYTAMRGDNYGWYQCCLHVWATRLLEEDGTLFQRFFDHVSTLDPSVPDDALPEALARKGAAQLGRLLLEWPPVPGHLRERGPC